MISIEDKILQALKTKKLNLNKLGERNCYNYFIRVTELLWTRNNHDGYLIEIYNDDSKKEHLGSLKI